MKRWISFVLSFTFSIVIWRFSIVNFTSAWAPTLEDFRFFVESMKYDTKEIHRITNNIRNQVSKPGTLWNYWHPPPRTKTKDLFINLRSNYFKVFTVGIESFLRPFQSRPEERKKTQLLKETLTSPLHHHQFFLPAKTAIPCVLSFYFEDKRGYKVDRWSSSSRRRDSRKPPMYRKKFSKASQEWLGTDADQNDSFSDSSCLFPIQPILQNEAMIGRTEANTILDLG